MLSFLFLNRINHLDLVLLAEPVMMRSALNRKEKISGSVSSSITVNACPLIVLNDQTLIYGNVQSASTFLLHVIERIGNERSSHPDGERDDRC